MIKLVMIIPTLKKGGAEKIFSFIANELDTNKFDVYLIIFDGDQVQFELNTRDITVINLQKQSVIKGTRSMLRELKKLKPDVIFTTVTHLNILIGMLRPFLPKCKIVVRESSVISINNEYQSFTKVFNYFIKIFYKRLDLIICQSDDMAQDLTENFNVSPAKIVVINNPITSIIHSTPVRKNTVVNFFSAGRLIATKGFERLINIVALLDFDFNFVIAGQGPEFSRLEEKIKEMGLQEKVTLLGEINDLEPYYEAANFYLHGSYYEGFPNTFLEAASYGVPIITFNTLGGINEIIKDGFNGFIANDNDEYYKMILKAINHDWKRNLIQEDISNRFNKNKILTQYENVLMK